jgi:hypothetical protein
MQETTTNYSERLEQLILRREKRNPGLAKVRHYKYGKKTVHVWDYLIMPSKSDLLKDWK